MSNVARKMHSFFSPNPLMGTNYARGIERYSVFTKLID